MENLFFINKIKCINDNKFHLSQACFLPSEQHFNLNPGKSKLFFNFLPVVRV